MRIAFLTTSLSREAGGLFVAMSHLARALRAENADVEVWGVNDRYTAEDRSAWNGVDRHVFPPRRPRAFGFAPGYREALDTFAPDVAHTHGLWQYPSAACAAWAARSGRPYVVSPHGMLDPWAMAHARLKKRLAWWVYQRKHLRRATCLHALCASESQAMRARGLTNPICIIPNAIDVPTAVPAASQPWLDTVAEGRKLLLFLGRLHPKKGLSFLLEGWRAARATDPTLAAAWRLAIAGWDQDGHRDTLEHKARALGIADDVRFLGPLHGERKQAALARADAFVLPSLSEGMPMAVLEAWAAGLPVLMTQACNLPEGFQADAALPMTADADGACEALARLQAMPPAAREAMGARGRQLVERRFTWDGVARRMRAVYDWLAGAAPPPPDVYREEVSA